MTTIRVKQKVTITISGDSDTISISGVGLYKYLREEDSGLQ
jgi:hypothetical protein